MCGIWVQIGWPDRDAKQMAYSGLNGAAHRGPDGQSVLEIEINAGKLVFGHARLAIYDKSANADQPMTRGPLTIVFNGSIYDHLDMRTKLEALGEVFQTTSDTEVILAGWLRYGPSVMTQFDGMFAACVYDARTQNLFCVRDRFGEKPLHCLETNEGIVLCSEIGQLLSAGLLKSPEVNTNVVEDFLDFGFAETGTATFFKPVTRLSPGHLRIYDVSKKKAVVTGPDKSLFSELPRPDPTLRDPQLAAEALRHALEVSVARRLKADVTVGSCLSGGLDSSAIVAIAAAQLRGAGDAREAGNFLKCFCAGFDEIGADGRSMSEIPYAQALANKVGADLTIIAPGDNDVVSIIDKVLSHQGEPFAHTSIVAQHAVFAAAHLSGVTCMLDGQGADELFAGYPGMLGHRLADVLASQGVQAWDKEIKRFAADDADMDEHALKRATFNALIPERARRLAATLRGRWPQPTQVTPRNMPLEPPHPKGLDRFESLMRRLQTRDSLPSLLRYEDRNAMAHAIESRLPFLGKEVVDIAWRLPASTKAANGWTKAVLRDAVADCVPADIVRRRRKLGFITPQDKWMKGELGDWTRAGISIACDKFADHLRTPVVKQTQMDIGKSASANAIGFRLAALGHWADRYKVSV